MTIARIACVVGVAAAGFAASRLRPSASARFDRARAACIGGSSASCEQVAQMLERRELPALYAEEPGHFHAMACEGGVASACAAAERWAKPYGDYEVFELDVGCMVKRSPFACEEVATTLHDETGEAAGDAGATLPIARSRMKRALNLYLAACDANQADACLGASRIYDAAFGVPWNVRESRAYEAKACTLGLAEACERAGDHASAADAVALYRRACEHHPSSPHACLKLARAQAGTGSPAAIVDASYRHACELLAFDACDHVAHEIADLHAEPPGVVRAFGRWCDAGDARACAIAKAAP